LPSIDSVFIDAGRSDAASASASIVSSETNVSFAPASLQIHAASRPCSLALIGIAAAPIHQMP
jgi:hypothetical protein